ncbi:MAG: PSD1 and planctomycete cytochrome C domain-containing protein [Planctomycetota bacterium]|nr:PSD1 and planctomycete cytochrome C domain-containing protein [Planctomycetota bacterium]
MTRIKALLALSLVLLLRPAAAADADFFEENIRPLFVERCQKCHGERKQEAGLRLDSAAALLKGGENGAVIVPGSSAKSRLYQAVLQAGKLKMPPRKKLASHEISALKRWIDGGAAWPTGKETQPAAIRRGPITEEDRRFWSFLPLSVAAEIKNSSNSSVIDSFILSGLTERGLEHAPKSEKRAFIRRASYDLTGLPPTDEAINAFLADDSSGAHSSLIDSLLDSPHYGERWGRHWLDVVRYADSAGETADYPVPLAYRYRNYVIRSFNADKPYDQFLREQIAGDLLAPADGKPDIYADHVTATGFLAVSRRFGFGIEEEHYLTLQDTIDTLGQATLGLTLGCARCHDHKYDPVTMEDYYALYGIFSSTIYSLSGDEKTKKGRRMMPLVPALEAKRLDEARKRRKDELETRKRELLSERTGLLSGKGASFKDGGFELHEPGQPPSGPWKSGAGTKVSKDAQSPFAHVYNPGERGVRLPADDQNNHFGQLLEKPLTGKEAGKLYFNIDFRHTAAPATGNGSYRFYIGHGPGTSPAVEFFATADELYARDGEKIYMARKLALNTWYNLQITLDLEARSYSAAVGSSPGELVGLEGKAFRKAWDGIIDIFFVDKYGHLAGDKPARDIDNALLRKTPIAELHDRVAEPRPGTLHTGWIEDRLLSKAKENADGRKGFFAWSSPNDLPSLLVNTTRRTEMIPGTAAPGSVQVHPDLKNGMAIAWRSPVEGPVRISGSLADSHDCGDSVAWRLDHLHGAGARTLASGSLSTGKSESFSLAGENEPRVLKNDFICLTVLPKVHHGCDLTRAKLVIEEAAGEKRSWDLEKDLVDDLLEKGKGNPHSDSHGNQDTWYIIETDPEGSRKQVRMLTSARPLDELPSAAPGEQERLAATEIELKRIENELGLLNSRQPYGRAYAVVDGEGKDARVQKRGDPAREGDIVPRRFLEVLGGDPVPAEGKESGRRELAEWITGKSSALAARVMVNRLWQHHFGRGLVRTPNDFGARGERPTHPELLDWLASRFIESGWSVKAMHRLIMLSKTYRQSSTPAKAAPEFDAENRLLWRFPRRRLDAESIRDSILFLSGELDTRMGEAHPFPSSGSWSFSQHAPFRAVYPVKKRSVYLMTQRISRHPFLAIFDGADTNASTASRIETTVPTQALFFMNSEFVHQNARAYAKKLAALTNDRGEQIERACRSLLGRPPGKLERARLSSFLESYEKTLGNTDESALEALFRVLVASNEFIYLD